MSMALASEKTFVEKVRSEVIFQSDFYEVKDWTVDFEGLKESSKGYNTSFCFVVVRTGNFLFDLSKESYNMHTGHIVIDKPYYEYRLRPAVGTCSIFNFTVDFYQQFVQDLGLERDFFFSNANILSLMLSTTPEAEYLHYRIMRRAPEAGKLEMDNLVLELLRHIVATVTNNPLDRAPLSLQGNNHLTTVEKAKEFLNRNFASDISLHDLSRHCCVSPFHFSRIFKRLTSYSPHQFLLNIRLKHAELLVKNTTQPIAEVSFASGFNSTEYFATAFRQKYKMNPTQYRNGRT